MNSSSPALHSSVGSPISCPQRPLLQRLQPSLHSTTFALSLSASPQQSLSVYKKRRKMKRQEKQQQQQQEVEVKGRLPLFDIYKFLSEMHDAHPCECIRTSVITTRQACVLSLCCCMVEVSRTSALMSTWRGTACVSWLV